MKSIIAFLSLILIATSSLGAGIKNADYCNATRLSNKCGEPREDPRQADPDKINTATIEYNIQAPDLNQGDFALRCEANLQHSYTQYDEQVRVELTVEATGCDEASGEYVTRIKTRDADGHDTVDEFPGQWSRDSSATVLDDNHYPVPQGREVKWVKLVTRPKTACRCATPSSAE